MIYKNNIPFDLFTFIITLLVSSNIILVAGLSYIYDKMNEQAKVIEVLNQELLEMKRISVNSVSNQINTNLVLQDFVSFLQNNISFSSLVKVTILAGALYFSPIVFSKISSFTISSITTGVKTLLKSSLTLLPFIKQEKVITTMKGLNTYRLTYDGDIIKEIEVRNIQDREFTSVDDIISSFYSKVDSVKENIINSTLDSTSVVTDPNTFDALEYTLKMLESLPPVS